MSETKWIDWKPKVGDVRPDVYRSRWRGFVDWFPGIHQGYPIEASTLLTTYYQIPAPVDVSPPATSPLDVSQET